MRGLKNKTVLLTGGANGIGAAIARRLADEGCVVGILDLDAAGGEKVAGEIRAKGGKVSFHATDISDYDAVKRAVDARELAERLQRDGIEPIGGDPGEFATLITREIAQWRELAKSASIKLD